MGKAFGNRSAEGNYFPTPYSMTEQLFQVEKFNKRKTVLEPACGYLHMTRILEKHFKKVVSYDLDPEFERQGDFYKETRKFDFIITNPPYSGEADKFVAHAKKICRKKFAFLLRTNFLSGETRLQAGTYEGLKRVYIFSRMPDMRPVIKKVIKGKTIETLNPIRENGKYPTAMNVMSWMIWEKGYRGNPQISWISNQEFVLGKKDEKES